MPHGFGDDEPTRLLLRSGPPQRTLDWAGLDGFHENPGPESLVVEDVLAAAVAELS